MLDRLSHTHIARSMRGHRAYLDIPRNFRRATPVAPKPEAANGNAKA